jgi:hypothetical protein
MPGLESAPKYHVVLYEWSVPNDMGEMTEMRVYGLLRTRLYGDISATEAILRELREKNQATVTFVTTLGKARFEIRRV